MLILDTGGRGFILPQLGMPEFVDSSRETLPPMRSGWGQEGGKVGEGQEKRREEELGLKYKMKKLNKKRKAANTNKKVDSN